MKVTHVCFLLLQFAAVAHGQCACTTTTAPQIANTTTAMMATTTTTAAIIGNTTTTADDDVNATTTAAPATTTASTGPSRLLFDKWDFDWDSYETLSYEDTEDIDRQLQDNSSADNSSDVTVTTTASTAATETSDADSCACPAPQTVSTFTATMEDLSVSDLALLDFEAIKDNMATNLDWGDDVEVVAVVKIGLQYTLSEAITEVQCKEAVASTYSVTTDKVECGAGSAGASNGTSAATTTTTTAAARRLQEVMDVTISFDDQNAASNAAISSQDTTAFVAALSDAGVTATAEVAPATVAVELSFSVSATDAIAEPSASDLTTAVVALPGADGVTFTGGISGFASSYDRMPCSEHVCGSGKVHIDNAETIGCDGAVCTAAEDDRCCVPRPATQANAQSICVAGSLLSVLTWNFF